MPQRKGQATPTPYPDHRCPERRADRANQKEATDADVLSEGRRSPTPEPFNHILQRPLLNTTGH